MHLSHPLSVLALSVLHYHLSELLLVVLFEPEELSFSSLLLSPAYVVAMAVGLIEFFLTVNLFPFTKHALCTSLRFPAIILLIVGEALRKTAWFTARASFTHRIKVHKRPQHRLVTTGVYAVCRHPGYLGWFIWALATQLILANPVSLLGFAVVIWRFFALRIPIEEYHLHRIFGEPYAIYRHRTPTLIPGIP